MRPPREMSVEIVTFGCRLNAYESELMRDRAGEAGLQDAILVNTCAVTAEAVRQARQAIRKARREHPERRVIVTGCAAQTEPATFAAMPEVDLVLGNDEKLTADAYRNVPDFGLAGEEKVRVNDIMSVRETASHMVEGLDGRARAFVQVQNGCDHRCTFCIIPYGRGNSRSVPMGAVVEQVRRLVDNGFREIVLTGVDITSYGLDLPGAPRLGKLVQSILKHVQGLARLRLSSIDSIEADADLMRAIAEEERLMPHLHLSLQAGDDLILKRMKRRHLRADAIRFCDDVRTAAARRGLRRRSDRRLPDRDRGHVREHGVDRRGMRARLPARLPVLRRVRARRPPACRSSRASSSSSALRACARSVTARWRGASPPRLGRCAPS